MKSTSDNHVILCVRDLVKDFLPSGVIRRKTGPIRALDEVDLIVRREKTLVIVGESGAGKSTLARCLAMLEKPTSGEILYEGRNLCRLRKADRLAHHHEIQMIFQDSASAMNPRMTAAEIIAEPLAIQCVGTDRERHERAGQLLEQVGLATSALQRYPLELSGGQRQRVAIARSLALEPKLLILDEALSSVDLASRQALLELLHRFQIVLGLTYVHICHDLKLAGGMADEVAVMHRGKIVEQRPAADLFACPEHEHTKELLSAMPRIGTILAQRSA
jgi:ABC-type glutathione transport system ATPase component